MKIPRRTMYALLASFACINLIVRQPVTPHGVGVDSFVFQVLSNSIVETGHAAWFVHPLSPFGLYPLSYPSGSFFITAALAATGGMTIEITAFVLSLVVGVLGIFTAFVMAREFFQDDVFCLAVALIFALMPRFVANTLWEVPTRSLLMALTPLFLWAVLRAAKSLTLKSSLMAVLVFGLMSTFHRLAVLMLVVFLAFLVMMIFVVGLQIVKRQFPRVLMTPTFRRRSRFVVLVLFFCLMGGLLLASGALDEYDSGLLYHGRNRLGELLNLVGSLSRSVGFLTPLAVVGLPAIIFRRNKAAAEFLFLSTPLAIVPTLFLRDYSGYYVVTFFALYVGAGFMVILSKLPAKTRARGVAILALLVVAVLSASQAVAYEVPRETFMTQSEYSAGLYVRYQVPGTLACNDGQLASRIASVTGAPYLPVGGATTPAYSPEAMSFGFVRSFQATPIALTELTVDADSFYVADQVHVQGDWSIMMSSHLSVGKTEGIAREYNVSYVCENPALDGYYATGWNVNYESYVLLDAYTARYKTFDSGDVRVWKAF